MKTPHSNLTVILALGALAALAGLGSMRLRARCVGSDTGVLNVFDATTGRLLKRIETGSSTMAAPATYKLMRASRGC